MKLGRIEITLVRRASSKPTRRELVSILIWAAVLAVLIAVAVYQKL